MMTALKCVCRIQCISGDNLMSSIWPLSLIIAALSANTNIYIICKTLKIKKPTIVKQKLFFLKGVFTRVNAHAFSRPFTGICFTFLREWGRCNQCAVRRTIGRDFWDLFFFSSFCFCFQYRQMRNYFIGLIYLVCSCRSAGAV